MHRYPIGFAGSARGRHRTGRPRLAGVLALGVSVVLGAGSVAVRADPIAAAAYDNTNPAATPCANDALTLRNFYVAYSGLIYAELQIRWSPSCKTVWTRTVNRTGHGAGYATARSLTSDEEIVAYNCTETSCMTHYEKETGDVLPSMDSTGFSHQFVIPAPGTAGSPPAPQPPTVRGIVWITWSGHSTPVQLDTNLEPLWTWEANGCKNERNLRVNSTVMTCDNSLSRCALGTRPCSTTSTRTRCRPC